jgi:hypothetical protein
MPTRRQLVAVAASAVLTPFLVAPLAGPATSAVAADGPMASSIAVAWQRTAIRTIYTEQGLAPPAGGLYLAFTSLAVHDAAVEAQRQGTHAAAAAVATAAHDVLRHYFPTSGTALDHDLAASLAKVPDGKKETSGAKIGAAAAVAMIASRVGDGRNDASIVYAKPPALGIWQPPPTGMALAWLGFVKPVVDIAPVVLDGPDPITSAAFAQDHEEVRLLGSKEGSNRSDEQTKVAQFFSANPVPVYRAAVCTLLENEPMGLLPTTRFFARVDAAMAMSFIAAWRLKFDIGYWRPFQAIAKAGVDDNPGTQPHPVLWEPLVPNPAYADYPSGHAQATSAFAQVLRKTLGDDTALVLRSGAVTRSYATLTALEQDAFHARIWGGLHFRDAMDDGYALGHTTADRVMRAVR